MPSTDMGRHVDFQHRFTSYSDWRAAAVKAAGDPAFEVRDGLPLGEAIIIAPMKFGETKAVNLEDGTAEFVVSTASRDRDRDAVSPKGWELDNFKKNPVVLWAHESWSPPLARATSIKRDGEALVSTALFYVNDEDYRFPRTVLRMLQGRFLNAVSAGFMPLEWTYNEEERGFDFKRQELYEYSVVPVPANPEALQRALKAGIDLEPLAEWAIKALDAYSVAKWSTAGIWVPRAQVEDALKGIKGLPFSMTVDGLTSDAEDTVKEFKQAIEKLVGEVAALQEQVAGLRKGEAVGHEPSAEVKVLIDRIDTFDAALTVLQASVAAAEKAEAETGITDDALTGFLAGIDDDRLKALLAEPSDDERGAALLGKALGLDVGLDSVTVTRIFESAIREVTTKAVDDLVLATTGRLPD